MGLYDFTFYDVIKRNSVCFKNRNAWLEIDDHRTLTFSQYKQEVDCLATGLQKYGVRKGDRIGVLGKNSLEYFLLYGAAAALGVIILPINWRLSSEEICYNLNDCEPRFLFADKEYEELIRGLKDRLLSVEQYVSICAAGGSFLEFNSLMENGDDFDPPEVCTDDGFVIIHTAAVSGRPRGALLSHGNVLCADMHFDFLFSLTPKDIHLNFLPLFHVAGLLMATSTFHAGALNLDMSTYDGVEALELISQKKVSCILSFSPILSSILDQHEKTGVDISSLRAVGGLEAPETIEKFQQVANGTFFCMYGQTETTGLATCSPYKDKPGSAGKMLPLSEIRLVDDYDRPVPVGGVGEITMKGPMVFKGYWNLPRDNEYIFRHGWHHTGDLGRFDEHGFLWYEGRKAEKELIKPGGENVYPAEVEKVILEHPAIERTVVFGVPDPKWKEGIKAVCKLNEGHVLEPEHLIDFVGDRIARFKKPQYVEFVTSLPLLANGELDRKKIKELYGGG